MEKDIQNSIDNIANNIKAMAKNDFSLLINWLDSIEKRIYKLETKKQNLFLIILEYYFKFMNSLIPIAILILAYELSKKN